MPVILQNIVHPIKSKILNIESLRINEGEFVGIIDAGEGGAAELGRIICGFIHPEQGRLSLHGADEQQSAVPFFFECECEKTFCETSVEKEVCRYIKGTKLKKDKLSEEAKSALELVGFDYDTIKSLSPFELSKGDRRRIALAAALTVHPEIIVLNDPMKEMDGRWCGCFMELMKEINKKGTTVILLSADTSRLSEAADRVIIMKNGEIVIDSSAKNVFSEYYALVHLGLPVPEVRKCCQMLRARGMDIPNNIILYDQFIDRLKILMWRKNK